MRSLNTDRRRFLKLSAAAAGTSLILGINWSCTSDSQPYTKDQPEPFSPNAWLRIHADGSVTVIVAEAEMGQGPYTAVPMLVAEELEVDWAQIKVKHASLDPVYGYQMTGGSSSIREGWPTLREAGAIARELLVRAGAQALSVPINECKAQHGRVVHSPSGQEVAYHELIESAAQQPIPEAIHLKEPHEFTLIGQPVARVDIPEKVNGKAQFGIDTRLPGMLYATIVHSPVLGGTAKNIDASEAKAIRGVIDIFQIDEGVVVVATDTWKAFKARDALKIDWNDADKADISTSKLIKQLKNLPQNEAKIVWEEGDTQPTLASSSGRLVTAEYIQPLQAHVALEPMNCTAHFRQDGKLEIWAPTQSPSAAYDTASGITQSKIERGLNKLKKKLFNSLDEAIDVHTTLLGGGFGRRINQDYVSEIVQIVQKYDKPVQLIWTREEDIQHDYYHPLTLHKMRGAIDEHGIPVAWEHIITGPKVSAGGASPPPYSIPNTRVMVGNIGKVIPTGPWRSVSYHYNAFAVEHFFDELARAGHNDPLELRLKLLENHPRLRTTLEIAADKTKWTYQSRDSVFYGAAAFTSFGSHVAQIVELGNTDKQGFKINRITCVVDCGIAINPDIVKQQMEGSIIYGLTAASKAKITISNGRVEQSNFNDYPILRIHEIPEIEVIIVENKEKPGGIGEPGVPPLAPALANAVLSATNQPVRELPIRLV